MHRNRPLAAFVLGLVLLSQSGCCCCVTIPTGPEQGNEFGEFLPPEDFPVEGEDAMDSPGPVDGLESAGESSGDAADAESP